MHWTGGFGDTITSRVGLSELVSYREFSTDPLVKTFGKLRQRCGGTYFVDAQQVTEKLRIDRPKLQLALHWMVDDGGRENHHNYAKCTFVLDEKAFKMFDGLPALEETLNEEELPEAIS